MNCSCQIDIDVGETTTLLQTKYQVANKDHICCECKKVISKGSRYLTEVCVWDGSPERFKTCSICEEIRTVLYCNWYYGFVMEDLKNYIRDGNVISEECLLELSTEARNVVFDLIEKYGNNEN